MNLKTKFASVKDIVQRLKKEQLVPNDKAQQIQSKFANLQLELANILSSNASRSRSYSVEIKKFALYLYYCSTKAYEFVRKVVCLPTVRTVGGWLARTACNPGFTQEAFDSIREKREASNS